MKCKYRLLPVTVEATQYDGTQAVAEYIEAWSEQRFNTVDPEDRIDDPDAVAAVFDILRGAWIPVAVGDWIIKGVKGEFYPCDPQVFAETYEVA